MKKLLTALALAAAFTVRAVSAQPLTIQSYNPGENGIFPVTSTLISGDSEAILIDAQFDIRNAQAVVDMIKTSGKKLTTIYISCGDPDYYFGLQAIQAAFPDAKVLASRSVVEHIQQTKEGKLAYWGPILGDAAPTSLTLPAITDSTSLTLEGETIDIKAINTPSAFLWVPSGKTILGGVAVSSGQHVWMADSQTAEARAGWLDTLNQMLALKPARVIPGHYLGEAPAGADAVRFTRGYIQRFEQALSQADDSAALINAMSTAYPDFPANDTLTISAKVATGEMDW